MLCVSSERRAQTMDRSKQIFAACVLLSASVFAAAQQNGYWRAASTNALAITSDIAISARSLSINYEAFPLAEIRKLTPAEASAGTRLIALSRIGWKWSQSGCKS